MIPKAMREISSGGSRRASFRGTSDPSTRNIGGRPAFKWMSKAPPRRATCKISLSSIEPPRSDQRGASLAFRCGASEYPTSHSVLLQPPSTHVQLHFVEGRKAQQRALPFEGQRLPFCGGVELDDLDGL